MSHQLSQFEKIDIPAVLLAGMFSDSLVLIDAVENKAKANPVSTQATPAVASAYQEKEINVSVQEPAESFEKITIISLGGFGKKVLVLLNEKNAVHISDASLELLTKMLAAVDLSMADIALVNLASQALSLEQIQAELDANTILFFGVEPSTVGLPMRFPFFQVQRWSNKTFLYSPSLEQLNTASEEQREHKKNLWSSLQKIFLK